MAGEPAPLRVLTNTPWLDGRRASGRAIAPVRLPGRPASPAALPFLALWRYDAALLNIDAHWLYALCAAKKLLPFARFRILSVDLILTRPRAGLRARLAFHLRRWLLKEVDRLVLYFRDTAELRRVYRIPAERVRYVPFKVNTRERVLSAHVSDEGFFLACGRSNRDYATLCDAFRGLPRRCVVLAPWDEAGAHGTRADGIEWPPNVERVSDDGTAESWNRWVARSHAVILPISTGILSPSGISTYLVAMAMGKCVIVTDGPGTRGMLDDASAVLVPPADAGALRAAVARVAEDGAFRASVAEAGRRYALSLGGEERLVDDLARELEELLAGPRRAAAPAPLPAHAARE